MTMKKFIRRSLFYILIFIAFNLVFLITVVSTDWNFRKRIEAITFNNPDFDLLVLGNSLAMDAIDCSLMSSVGIKSYNLAIAGASVRTNYIQLSEYLQYYSEKPSCVLLALGSFGDDFADEVIHPIVEVTMKDHRFRISDLPISKFEWLGVQFLKKVVSSKHRQARIVNGQLKFQKVVPDNTEFNELYFDTQLFKSSIWIEKIAGLCDQNGINLIVIELPGYRHVQNMSEVGPYTISFNNEVLYNLYNFNSREFCRMFDSGNDWIGNSHLNEYGAIKFTGELIKIIPSNICRSVAYK